MEFYKLSVREAEKHFQTSITHGLSEEKAKKRLEKYGKNKIEIGKPPSRLRFFLKHLREFVSLLLIFVALIAFSVYFFFQPKLEHLVDGTIIVSIVFINASLGAMQEYKSSKIAEKIKRMIKTRARVIREGRLKVIDAEYLVPGDLVKIKAGDKVPADLRLVECKDLEIEESVLTGESMPVAKHSEAIKEDKPLAERSNMAFMNTYVTRGEALGIVVATGFNTEVGKIAKALEEKKEKEIPFVQEVSETAKQISYLALAMVAVSALVFGLYGKDVYEIFMLAAALIIGSIPAALPVTVTFTLSHAMKKMAERNALVKTMPLLETLGGVDVICVDKTGTLTENRMVVKKFYLPGKGEVTRENFHPNQSGERELVNCILAANEVEFKKDGGYEGPPEDTSLFEFLERVGVNPRKALQLKRVDFLPFSSEHKMVQAVVKLEGVFYRFTKGAPEVILRRCNKILVNGEVERLDEGKREEIRKLVDGFSEQALRNIAFSFKPVKEGEANVKLVANDEIFIGFVGMWDPPREGVRDAIATCYEAGIEVKMLTGDSKKTAAAIAKECGMRNVKAISWEEIKDLSQEEMVKVVKEYNVFARMDPELKMRIIDALHALGKRVAITGDGVNDVPAIKAAEVGIAMGKRGSDIARDAADIILLDDSFPTIKEAIKYGRTCLSNVRKVVNYLMTANLFEVIVIFLSSLAGFAPFRAIQVLWVNFATDVFPAIGLGTDPPHPWVMKKKPTGKEEKILTKRIWYLLVGIGVKKVAVVFLTFFLVLYLSGILDYPGKVPEEKLTTILGIKGDLVLAQTAVFVWLMLSHIVRIVSIRWDEGWKWRKVFLNKWVNYSLLWPLVATLIILYLPFNDFALAHFFYSKPLPIWVWNVLGFSMVLGITTAIAVTLLVDKLLGGYGEREY